MLAIASGVTYALYKRTMHYEKKQKDMPSEETAAKEPSTAKVAKIIRS